MATKKTQTLDPALAVAIAADTSDAPAPDLLGRIKATALELRMAQRMVGNLNERTTTASKEVARLSQEVLPSLMDEAAMERMVIDEDEFIRTKEVYASISAANAEEATRWLDDNGFGALVKTQFSIVAEKGDTRFIKRVRALLDKAKVPYEMRSGVHAGTLKAFVKEQVEAAKPLPKSITHHVQPVVVVKPIKQKRSK